MQLGLNLLVTYLPWTRQEKDLGESNIKILNAEFSKELLIDLTYYISESIRLNNPQYALVTYVP